MKELFNKILSVKYIHIEHDASFYTERDGDTLYLLFEWSNGKTDWKNNLDFPATPYRDMKNKWFAHRGFLRVWKAIEPLLETSVRYGSQNRIVIGGYSHGAAIALLCHEYCKYHRPDIEIVGYGFGCPRVVWGPLRRNVKQRFEGFTVVRKGRDIVTHVPPVLFGFRHVGKVLTLGKSAGQVKDHYPQSYIDVLQ